MEFLAMIPSFGGLLYTVLAFVVALSIVVFVHEYGHYIVGRWCGIRAEVFSVGFGPVLASRTDRRGTRWQIAALPLGGFVRFAGDADAASRPDGAAVSAMSPEARRASMAGAPLWARAATVAAGPAINLVFAAALFAVILMLRGVAAEAPVVGALKPLPLAHELRAGDRILAIDGQPVAQLADVLALGQRLPAQPLLAYRVDRAGSVLDVAGPHPAPPLAASVAPRSAAADVGIAPGDVILAIDGSAIATFEQLRAAVAASDGRALLAQLWRPEGGAGATLDFALTPRRVDLPLPGGSFETRWMIGLSGGLAFEPPTRTPGPLEALRVGVTQTLDVVRTSISGFWHVVTGKISTCNISGPIGIAETSGAVAAQGAFAFFWFVAVLSAAVGVMNLLPVPVLDGGHLVLHAYEGVSGRRPSDRLINALMLGGLALILTLTVLVTANDLLCP
jgi:regulator of sigma E protease